MSIVKSAQIGTIANNLSKQIAGSDDVSLGRTVVATGTGAALGAAASGAITVGAAALGIASAPVAIPLALTGAVFAGIASLFD